MKQRQLTEFELGENIGVGTVGAIFQAQDKVHDCTVAVKILQATVSEDPVVAARFEREMLVLGKLSHPHIVHYFGGGRDGRQLFYAMELIAGGSLRDLLNESVRLPWQEVAGLAIQVCSALQHAHNHGVIHRDLKPTNLMFTPEGEVKLTDFGIALDATAPTITAAGLTVGSYAYMSPEQIKGEDVTGKTDLYALGCLLFEALTGRLPYPGKNFAEIFEQHLKSEPPSAREFDPDIPEAIDQLLRTLLAKDPEQRPFNARAVQAMLMQVIDPVRVATEDTAPAPSAAEDVPASAAVDRVQNAIRGRVAHRTALPPRPDVSWLRLGVVFAAIVITAVVAYLAGTLQSP